MASYHLTTAPLWSTPRAGPYDGNHYTTGDDHYHSSHQYIQPQVQHRSYEGPDRTDYPQEARYGSAYTSNDPSSFPDLSTSPSISSGSSIENPSARSYQNSSGSHFLPVKRPQTLYRETQLKYPQYPDDGDAQVKDAGSLFANMNLEDYPERIEPGAYDRFETTYPPRNQARRDRGEAARYEVEDIYDETEAVMPVRSRRHSHVSSRSQIKPQQPDWMPPAPAMGESEREEAVREEVDDIFDEAEDEVTEHDWTMESRLKPGIAKCGKETVRVIRESEEINRNLKAVAAALAAYRQKRKQRPSFSSRTSSSSTKVKSSSHVVYVSKHKPHDRDRDRDRHARKRYEYQ